MFFFLKIYITKHFRYFKAYELFSNVRPLIKWGPRKMLGLPFPGAATVGEIYEFETVHSVEVNSINYNRDEVQSRTTVACR